MENLTDRVQNVYVSSILVRALVEIVQQRGITPEALLGRDAATLHSEPLEHRIPLADYRELFARAIHLTADPALGLHFGSSATEASFGLLGALVPHTPTLRHALQLVAQFHPLLADDVRFELTEHTGIARLRSELLRPHVESDRSLLELMVAGLARTLRGFGGARSDIHAVCFEYTRPAYHHAYTAAFAGAERFSQSFTGIEFSSDLLDRPHLHSHPELETLLRAQAEHSLQRLRRPLSSVDRVRALVGRHGQTLSMTTAARELGLSVRSLRRRLDDEGTSFRAVMQSMLEQSACSLLRSPDLTLQVVAHAVGFSESTAFHKAFKRWTGLTPAEYRSSQLKSH